MATTKKPKKRQYTKTGTSRLQGGEGKSSRVLFRGQTYYFYSQAWLKGTSLTSTTGCEAKAMRRNLIRDGYKVRFTKATKDGVIVNVYTRPEVPRVPHRKPMYG